MACTICVIIQIKDYLPKKLSIVVNDLLGLKTQEELWQSLVPWIVRRLKVRVDIGAGRQLRFDTFPEHLPRSIWEQLTELVHQCTCDEVLEPDEAFRNKGW